MKIIVKHKKFWSRKIFFKKDFSKGYVLTRGQGVLTIGNFTRGAVGYIG